MIAGTIGVLGPSELDQPYTGAWSKSLRGKRPEGSAERARGNGDGGEWARSPHPQCECMENGERRGCRGGTPKPLWPGFGFILGFRVLNLNLKSRRTEAFVAWLRNEVLQG